MLNYIDPKRVPIEEGIDMIPDSINYILSESLMVLKLYTKNKKRVIRLAKIDNETLVSSVILKKYIGELL